MKMSLFRDFCARIFCCFGEAEAAPILHDESGRSSDDLAPSLVVDQPQGRESQPNELSVREQLEKMQGDIIRMGSQIERLRIFAKENADDIFRINDHLRRATVTYSPNYLHEEQEVITGLNNEEDIQESENAVIPTQAITNRLSGTPTLNNDDNYKMDHKNRGKFIIFAHTCFDNSELPGRPCTINEAARVKQTFKKIGFKVIIYNDRTYKQIKRVLYDLCKEDYTEDDCIGIYVSTHGENGMAWAKDKKYRVNIFEDTLCNIRSLVGKPKIIFIQACRGNKVDKGFDITNINEESSDDSDEVDYAINHSKTPTRADTFIIYSTSPGYLSWRRWMMTTFCDMMDKYGDEDFVTILTKTNNEISKYESNHEMPELNEAKQICCFDITPRKKIYFL